MCSQDFSSNKIIGKAESGTLKVKICYTQIHYTKDETQFLVGGGGGEGCLNNLSVEASPCYQSNFSKQSVLFHSSFPLSKALYHVLEKAGLTLTLQFTLAGFLR